MYVVEAIHIQQQYNRWMNEHLFKLCDQLPDHKRKKPMGAYFSSVHRTLNHILLVDRLWLGRFQQVAVPFVGLDQELYSDYEQLKSGRRETDEALQHYLAGLGNEDMERTLTFTSAITHKEHTFLLGDCLLHMFHHQTHHRGQATTLLSQLGIDIGNTDLLWMPGIEQRAQTPR